MHKRPPVICSCGQELPRPIPRICPNCQCEISRIVRTQSPVWIPILLVAGMFGILLGLIILLANYVN